MGGPKPLEVRNGVWPPEFRGKLDAIVFFGPHIGGELLDPEELVVLGRLLDAAGIAFEHVAAQAAIVQSDELRAENATLRGLLSQRAT